MTRFAHIMECSSRVLLITESSFSQIGASEKPGTLQIAVPMAPISNLAPTLSQIAATLGIRRDSEIAQVGVRSQHKTLKLIAFINRKKSTP